MTLAKLACWEAEELLNFSVGGAGVEITVSFPEEETSKFSEARKVSQRGGGSSRMAGWWWWGGT